MTYREMLAKLSALSEEELDQNAMICPHSADGDETLDLQPVVGVYSVKELEVVTRSDDDAKHHPEQIIIFIDLHSFDKDGDDVIEMDPDFGDIGVRSGKVK